MDASLRKWLQAGLFNLLIVALLGLTMRYKILYPLGWIDQRNLLQAHSHFAFAGWISQVIMTLMVAYLKEKSLIDAFRRYRHLLRANMITAYGMLLSFPFMEYKAISIAFSTGSILVSYVFAWMYWRDLNRLVVKSVVHRWFRVAMLFNVISSFGAFFLAYMLASKNIHPSWYLASIYFFLHFQYNGWFFFAGMGLLSYRLLKIGAEENKISLVYFLFVAAILPAYFLSALWLPIPAFIYWIVVLAVLIQLAGWWKMILIIGSLKKTLSRSVSSFSKWLFILAGIALTIKLLLQAGSVIPSLSRLAFGFRPIIIGYLHLVLLGVTSIFLLAYICGYQLIKVSHLTKTGLIIFISGIIFNELLLMWQGISDMNYHPVPVFNRLLLYAALLLATGCLFVNVSQLFIKYARTHKEENLP